MDKLEEVLKNTSIVNEDLTFNADTTYLEFLLSNASTKEEEEEEKKIINNFLEITDEEENKNSDD